MEINEMFELNQEITRLKVELSGVIDESNKTFDEIVAVQDELEEANSKVAKAEQAMLLMQQRINTLEASHTAIALVMRGCSK